MGELIYMFYPRNKSKKQVFKWFGSYPLCQAKHPAYEIDLGNKKQWVTRDKLKKASENAQVVDHLTNEKGPKPSEIDKSDDSGESDSDFEVVMGVDQPENVIPPRYNRRYNLRPNPAIVQSLGNYYTHCLKLIESIYFN